MTHSTLIWLVPSLWTLVLYGLGQGLVKKYIGDVEPARFCLFFVFAKGVVNVGYFLHQTHPDPFDPAGHAFLVTVVVAALCDGVGWILYFKSILKGPITIVGTLSAAYPAITVLFARVFLAEALVPLQYLGVFMVIGGCIALSYEREPSERNGGSRGWVALASGALVLWAAAQTLMKYAYGLPQASDANLALFATFGSLLTLGFYGLRYGRRHLEPGEGIGDVGREWLRSLLPMGMMAGGDLGVIIATETGPVSVVTPLTGAYPVVTILFAAFVLKERIAFYQYASVGIVLVGIYLAPGSG